MGSDPIIFLKKKLGKEKSYMRFSPLVKVDFGLKLKIFLKSLNYSQSSPSFLIYSKSKSFPPLNVAKEIQ